VQIAPTVAGGPYPYLGPRQRPVQLQLHVRCLDGLAAPGEPFVQAVEASDIARVLAGAGQCRIEV
jgi:hypothetical protein